MTVADSEREQVAAVLRRHFDDGRIDTGDYAQRVERAFTALSREDLDTALDGLPLLPSTGVAPRGRRHGEGARSHPGWRPTTERFRDPSTNRVMRVWVDPADGTRHYVPD